MCIDRGMSTAKLSLLSGFSKDLLIAGLDGLGQPFIAYGEFMKSSH